MNKEKDLGSFYLQTLSQTVAERDKEVSEYACNVFADKIAQINLILGLCGPDDKEEFDYLTQLKQFYMKIGTALWFMKSGELSNLGARLGSTINTHKVRE